MNYKEARVYLDEVSKLQIVIYHAYEFHIG